RNAAFSTTIHAILSPTEEMQRERGILNFSLVLYKEREATGAEEAVLGESAALARLLVSKSPADKAPLRRLCLPVRTEQAPTPENRIILSEQTDALGNRRAKLVWRMSEPEKR